MHCDAYDLRFTKFRYSTENMDLNFICLKRREGRSQKAGGSISKGGSLDLDGIPIYLLACCHSTKTTVSALARSETGTRRSDAWCTKPSLQLQRSIVIGEHRLSLGFIMRFRFLLIRRQAHEIFIPFSFITVK